MDRLVIVEKLHKEFEVVQKKPGFKGTLSSILSPQKSLVNALDSVTFSLKKGELVGFIGPNGAGKTTTLKILSGILYPTSGFVQVSGFTPWERKRDYLRSIALVMGQKNQLWWDLPAIETFELNRAIYEIPEKQFKKNLNELVELLNVGDLLDRRVRRLSLGQRMRLELVAALLHRPEVIFMDEPTIGLDVIAQKKMRDFIKVYNQEYAATIILTSHNMDDVVDLAKRVIVIDSGNIYFDGALAELVKHFAKEKHISIVLSQKVKRKELERIGELRKYTFPEAVIAVPRSVATVAAAELLQEFPIEDLTIEEESIEDVIRRVFEHE